MSDRVEAAAMAINTKHQIFLPPWSDLVRSKDRANQQRVARDREYASAALAAADDADAEHGIVRLSPADLARIKAEAATKALQDAAETAMRRRRLPSIDPDDHSWKDH